MPASFKDRLYRLLRWSERYTKTDMVYLMRIGWWMNLGSIVTSLLSLFLYIAFSHFIPKDVYGTYQYLLSIGTIVSAFTLTGMNSAVARSTAQGFEGDLRRSIAVQLQWGVLPFIGACLLGAYYFFQANSVIALGLIILGIFTPINNALNTYGVYVAAKNDFRRGFIYTFVLNGAYTVAIIATALIWKNALALLIVNLGSQAIMLILIYVHVLKTYRPSSGESDETIPYGMHLTVLGFIGALVIQSDNILAFHFLGATTLAIYSFATAIPDRLASLFKFLSSATLLKLANSDKKNLYMIIDSRLLLIVAATFIIAGVYALFAPVIFHFLFPQYNDSIRYSMVYSLIILAIISDILVAALTATRSLRRLYFVRSIAAIVQICLQAFGVVFGGLWGLLFAKILGSFVPALLILPTVSKKPSSAFQEK